jgi:uncharacterized protein (DUF1684 family)
VAAVLRRDERRRNTAEAAISTAIKGADLGISGADIVLDFNFAYNPSCVRRALIVSAVATGKPPPFAIAAGERML